MSQNSIECVLIGGSPSSGSSLLRNILNRHSKIFCGPETGLFTFPEFYKDWGKYKFKLLTPLKNTGWYRKEGIDLLDPEFGIDMEHIRDLLLSSNQFPEFVNPFFKKVLSVNRKEIWAEKTPANARCFAPFLNHFERAKTIHVIRNPYDCVSSQVNRGLSHYYSAVSYLLNVLAALQVSNNPNYIEIKYEDLVHHPAKVVSGLCLKLNLPFESEMLIGSPVNRYDPTILEGWNYEETGDIQSGSVGRFDSLGDYDKAMICQALEVLRKPNLAFDFPELKADHFHSFCQIFDYTHKEYSFDKKIQKHLKRQRMKEMLIRTVYRYPMNMRNYPITLSDAGS